MRGVHNHHPSILFCGIPTVTLSGAGCWKRIY